jgi:hypothetical protein
MSEEQPVAVETPPAAPPPAEPAAPPPDPEAVADAALEAGAIEIPEGDGLIRVVPLAAVTTAREEAKQAKQREKAAAKELADLQAKWTEAAPYVDAAKAILAAQPQQPPQGPQAPAGPTPEQTAELEEVARLLDFYKTDGSVDLERATKHQAMVRKEAERIAAASIAPIQQDAAFSRAQAMLEQAKAWKDPVSGEQADPKVLANMFNRVSKQQGGLDTLANPEAVMVLWGQAINLKRWGAAANGQQPPAQPAAPQPPPGPPVFVETAGGQAQPVTMSAMEQKAARDMGLSDAEYQKQAAAMPWRK